MNLDRATLNYLNSFPETAKNEGQRLHDEGCVAQIFGTHLFIQGRVEDGAWSCRTSIRLQGNEWGGSCGCGAGEGRCPQCQAVLFKQCYFLLLKIVIERRIYTVLQ